MAGTLQSNRTVLLRNITLPEFSKHYRIDQQVCHVVDTPCYYDIILGRDFLRKIKMHQDFETQTMTAFGITQPMRKRESLSSRYDSLLSMFDDPDEWFFTQCFQSNIQEAKYEAVDIHEVVKQQNHLTEAQKQSLLRVLQQRQKLFSGKLGRYPHKKMDLELVPNAKPIHLKPYPVAKAHEDLFKQELQRLCNIGVLRRVGTTEWAFPTFIIPKKDGRVRWVSDFRKLNELIRRKQYPLPKIYDVLRKRKGYTQFTKIDISMQYYTFELTDKAKELCVIVTPYGKFEYQVAPMGVKQSPDFAQEIMEEIFHDMDDVDVYIDDIGYGYVMINMRSKSKPKF